MVKIIACLIFITILVNNTGKAQYYSTGQDPASIRWRQIKTKKYQLIYPSDFEKKAQYLANIMDIIVRSETNTLQSKVPRIPILLHTQSTVSNGLTVWAPKRIEMYTCIPQITYSEEWLEQLAIHEYRHAVQISKMKQGFTKVLYYILGEQAIGAKLGLFIPSWFLEGDATVTETALSNSGRGRFAPFEAILRAQVLEKGIYSYDKATLGSYKTFIPSAYELGYFLVGQSRKKYGAELWNYTLDRVGKYPFIVIPFSSGIHRYTHLTKTKLYKETLMTLDSAWKIQANSVYYTQFKWVTHPAPKTFNYYNHPLFINDSTILADKSSTDDIDRFVLIDRKTGKERILLTPGSHISGTTSITKDYIVWAEQEPDPRWQNKDYAELKLYDFRTHRIRDLTHETRYFSPIVSPDESKIAAVHVSTDNQGSIHILDLNSGEILQKFPFKDYSVPMTPNWSPDGKKIIFTYLDYRGETIAELDISTGSIRYLFPFSFNTFLGPAYLFRNYIIYSVDVSGIENIYAFDTVKSITYQITSSKFAGFDPDFSSDKSSMIYSNYSSDGLMVAETPIDTSAWVALSKVKNHSIKLYEALSNQENFNIQDSVIFRKIFKMNQSDKYDLGIDSIQGILHPTKKYSRWLTLFNPHSWAPASLDINNLTISPGISVLSQNVLSSAFAGAGYAYDLNEQTGKVFLDLSYQGWYPVFNFAFSYGQRASNYTVSTTSEKVRFTWMETNFGASVDIPWNFNHGKYYRKVKPSLGTTLINITHNSSTPHWFTNGLIQTMDYSVEASQYLHSSPKDMYPKWGQWIGFNFRNSPFSANDMGSIIGMQTNLYFPGFFRHHSFWFYGGFQQSKGNTTTYYDFEDIIHYPRGYDNENDEKLFSLGFNYKFPLFYPDLSIGSLLYFKRFKLNFFFDYAEGSNPGSVNIYKSTGAELTADFHILRFPFPIEMGVRSIYFPDTDNWGWQFVYYVNY